MDKPPSPSCSNSSLFMIGRNSRGNWVVRDQKGLCGGLFVDRAEAVKFAMFENGRRPQAVIMVPGILELDMSASQAQLIRLTRNLRSPALPSQPQILSLQVFSSQVFSDARMDRVVTAHDPVPSHPV
jgi:hypothetical protein